MALLRLLTVQIPSIQFIRFSCNFFISTWLCLYMAYKQYPYILWNFKSLITANMACSVWFLERANKSKLLVSDVSNKRKLWDRKSTCEISTESTDSFLLKLSRKLSREHTVLLSHNKSLITERGIGWLRHPIAGSPGGEGVFDQENPIICVYTFPT